MFSKEMQSALEADGKKLQELTGEDHGPHFLQEVPMESKMLGIAVHISKDVLGQYVVESVVIKECSFMGVSSVKQFLNQVGSFDSLDEARKAAATVLEVTEFNHE